MRGVTKGRLLERITGANRITNIANLTKIACSLILSLGFNKTAQAEWKAIHSENPAQIDMTVLEANLQGTTLQFKVNGFEAEKINIYGKDYTQVSIPEVSNTDSKGLPSLPRLSKNIMVPFSTQAARLEVLKINTASYHVGKIAPSKGEIYRHQDPAQVPYTFSSFYSSRGEKFPTSAVKLSETFIMRDIRGLNVSFFPAQYDSATGTLTVVTDMTVRVVTTASTRGNSAWSNSGSLTSDFMNIYSKRLVNFSALNADRAVVHKINEGDGVLIISNSKYSAALKPFVEWKAQMGWKVNHVTMGPETGTTYQQIKKFVQKEYDAKKISYLILVGDADDIPPHLGTSGNAMGAEADPMYGLTAGNDNYPDVFVSRISVNNIAQLEIVLSKIINYEKYPDPNGDWYSKAVGIASNEGDPTDKWRAELLRDMMLKSDFVKVDQFYDPGATAAQVTTALNEGRGFINFIGHGSKDAWGTTGFSNSHIDLLANGNRLPTIVSVACVNGQFQGGADSFAEHWLKVGTKEEPKGAVAIFASSTNQSWVPPTVGQKEIVRMLTSHEANTIGSLMIHGSVAVIEDASSTANQTFQTWHIFGDATMQVRTKAPSKFQVNLPEALNGNEKELELNFNEAGVRVGLMKGGEQIGSGVTDLNGNLVIPLASNLAPGDMIQLTVTGFNRIPLMKQVRVGQGPTLVELTQ